MSYDFPDYLPQELIKIAVYASERRGIRLNEKASELLYKN